MWIKTVWGGYWQDPYKAAAARQLGEQWARETLEELRREIEGKRPRKR